MWTTASILLSMTVTSCLGQYQTVPRGKKYSEVSSSEYKLYFQDGQGNMLSPWHDVPLFTQSDRTNLTYNLIVEIPRFSQAKFEIHREHLLNPIVQDKEDGQLRYLPNIFPWHGHICNYGAFPQTWENPFHEDEWTGLRGDKDPIDVCEIGSFPVPTGTVLPVRILGILAMIDGGETDWKVIVMNREEAAKKKINTLEDLYDAYPDLVDSVRKFFRVYKVPSGKPENIFAYDGEVKDEAFAAEVIRYTHVTWKEMIGNCSISGEEVGSFNTGNTLQGSACTLDKETAREEVQRQPEYDPVDNKLPNTVSQWSFLMSSSSSRVEIFRPLCGAMLLVILFGGFM